MQEDFLLKNDHRANSNDEIMNASRLKINLRVLLKKSHPFMQWMGSDLEKFEEAAL